MLCAAMSGVSSPESQIERRERRRFPVRLNIDVYHGSDQPHEALTRDASEIGISFFCDTDFPQGSAIEFNVHVPEEVADHERIFVRGRGTVVRSEQQTLGRFLVAAVTEGYTFREL